MSSASAQVDGPGFRVIEPKLMLPRVHPGMLRRARLLEMLDGDTGSALTVLNAAVGYGKTTLVRSWCIERPGGGDLGHARLRRRRPGAPMDAPGDSRRAAR